MQKNLKYTAVICISYLLLYAPFFLAQTVVDQINANAIALQSDGKIIIAGTLITNNVFKFYVARYLTTGVIDTSYNTVGLVSTPIGTEAQAYGVAVQPSDGRVVAVGYALVNGTSQIAIVRYTIAGALDTTFNGTGILTQLIGNGALATSVAIDSNNKIVIGGVAIEQGVPKFLVARYNADGSADNTFGSTGIVMHRIGARAKALALAIQPSDGKIVAAGFSSNGISEEQFALARFNTDGSVDGTVTASIGTRSHANSVAIQSDGKIVLGGFIDTDFALARYNSNGSIDTTFNGDGVVIASLDNPDEIRAIAIQADGKIVAGGRAGNFFALGRFNTDGSLDTGFGTGGLVTSSLHTAAGINALVIQTDGKIIVAGYDDNHAAVARFTTTGSLDTTFAENGLLNLLADVILLDGEIIFTSFSMTKDAVASPETKFNDVYTTSGVLFPLRVWSLHPSGSTQEAITLLFNIPEAFDMILPVEVELHLIIDNKAASGNNAAILVRADFKENNASFGAAAGGAEQTITSSTITFTEPSGNNLKHVSVTIPLKNSGINPGDIAFMAFTRAAPSGAEYNADIYLSSVSFKFKKFVG